MGQAQVQLQELTLDEWIALEKSNDTRYEYHFGEVYAMAGGTYNHTQISDNAFYELEDNSRKKDLPCRTHSSDLKIEVTPKGRYVYPDTLVVCGEIEHSKKVKGAIRNPILVVEVVSESSEAYDRGAKFRYYRQLSSLREYLILEQAQPAATLYRRSAPSELFTRDEIVGMDSLLSLESVDLEVPLGRFYRNVDFGDSVETTSGV